MSGKRCVLVFLLLFLFSCNQQEDYQQPADPEKANRAAPKAMEAKGYVKTPSGCVISCNAKAAHYRGSCKGGRFLHKKNR